MFKNTKNGKISKKYLKKLGAENIKFIFKEIISACFTLEKKIKVYYSIIFSKKMVKKLSV